MVINPVGYQPEGVIMVSSIIMRAEAVRSLAFGSIGASYAAVGDKLTKPARMVIIQNFTDADLMFSFDGSIDHIPLKSDSSIILDLTANKTDTGGFFLEIGTSMNVKRIGTPSSGDVYVSVIYGKR